MIDMDMDVADPTKVSAVMRRVAQAYAEGAGECAAAWGDPGAGRVWTKIARIIEKAADQIDKAQS